MRVTPDHGERPAWFDELMLNYRKALMKITHQMEKDDPEELYLETTAYCFRHWHYYRPEYGFYNWLAMAARHVRREARIKIRNRFTHVEFLPNEHAPAAVYDPTDNIELRRVMDAVPPGRDGAIFLRTVGGEGMAEIGRDLGLSKQRVKQIVDKVRSTVTGASERAV